MNQVAMYLHVLPDLDVRLEVGGVDVPGGDGGPDERPYAVAHEDDAGDQAGPVWQPLQRKRTAQLLLWSLLRLLLPPLD